MNKNILGIPVVLIIPVLLGVILMYVGIILASLDARRGLDRLEEDMVVLQTTQFEVLQELSSNSATISATVSGKIR